MENISEILYWACVLLHFMISFIFGSLLKIIIEGLLYVRQYKETQYGQVMVGCDAMNWLAN
jgi:hypothetical protein